MKQNFSSSLGFILFVIILFILVTVTMGEKPATFLAGLILLSMLVINGKKLSTQFNEIGNMISGNPYDTGSNVKVNTNLQGVKLA